MMIVRILLAALLWAGCAVYGMGFAQAQSQTYPNRPIRMIVPFPAGGPTDGMARIVSGRFNAVIGQTVFVENRGAALAAVSALSSSPPPIPTDTRRNWRHARR